EPNASQASSNQRGLMVIPQVFGRHGPCYFFLGPGAGGENSSVDAQKGMSRPLSPFARGVVKTSLPSYSRCNSANADRAAANCQTVLDLSFGSTRASMNSVSSGLVPLARVSNAPSNTPASSSR